MITIENKITINHKPFYLTFGSCHAHPEGFFLIWSENYSDARAKAISLFGYKFAFLYDRDDWIRNYLNLDDLIRVKEIIL